MGKVKSVVLIASAFISVTLMDIHLFADEPGVSPSTDGAFVGTLKPSRMVSASEIEEYVTSIARTFRVTAKGIDPFGLSQDLTAKSTIHSQPKLSEPDLKNQIPLSEIVKGIKVNLVYGGDKRIVVGSTPYKVGDQLRVRSKGKFIDLVLTEVTTEKLSFRSVETGEVATRSSSQRPKGMVPGGAQTTPQGLSPSNQSPPIIDVGVDESAP